MKGLGAWQGAERRSHCRARGVDDAESQYGPFKNAILRKRTALPVPERSSRSRVREGPRRTRRVLHPAPRASRSWRRPPPRVASELDSVPIESQYPGWRHYQSARTHRLQRRRRIPVTGPAGRERRSPAFAELENGDGLDAVRRALFAHIAQSSTVSATRCRYASSWPKVQRRPCPRRPGVTRLVPGPAHGLARYGCSGRRGVLLRRRGDTSASSIPFTASSTEFSLIQIGLSNSVPWVQAEVNAQLAGVPGHRRRLGAPSRSSITPPTEFFSKDDDYQRATTPTSRVGNSMTTESSPARRSRRTALSAARSGRSRSSTNCSRDNWWLNCQGRWVGHYPAGSSWVNDSVFDSGRPCRPHRVLRRGWRPWRNGERDGHGERSLRPRRLRALCLHAQPTPVNSGRNGEMVVYDGSNELLASDVSLYTVDAHFNSGSSWGSYLFVGGPGPAERERGGHRVRDEAAVLLGRPSSVQDQQFGLGRRPGARQGPEGLRPMLTADAAHPARCRPRAAYGAGQTE